MTGPQVRAPLQGERSHQYAAPRSHGYWSLPKDDPSWSCRPTKTNPSAARDVRWDACRLAGGIKTGVREHQPPQEHFCRVEEGFREPCIRWVEGQALAEAPGGTALTPPASN
jgi:hypothetical protein